MEHLFLINIFTIKVGYLSDHVSWSCPNKNLFATCQLPVVHIDARQNPSLSFSLTKTVGIQGYSGKGNVETAIKFTHCLAHHSTGCGSVCQEIKIFMRMLSMEHVYTLLICMCSANSSCLAQKPT